MKRYSGASIAQSWRESNTSQSQMSMNDGASVISSSVTSKSDAFYAPAPASPLKPTEAPVDPLISSSTIPPASMYTGLPSMLGSLQPQMDPNDIFGSLVAFGNDDGISGVPRRFLPSLIEKSRQIQMLQPAKANGADTSMDIGANVDTSLTASGLNARADAEGRMKIRQHNPAYYVNPRRQSLPYTIEAAQNCMKTFPPTAPGEPRCSNSSKSAHQKASIASALVGNDEASMNGARGSSQVALERNYPPIVATNGSKSNGDADERSDKRSRGAEETRKRGIKRSATVGSNDEDPADCDGDEKFTSNVPADLTCANAAGNGDDDDDDAVSSSSAQAAIDPSVLRRYTANSKMRLSRKRSLLLKQKSLPSFLETVEEESTVLTTSTEDRAGAFSQLSNKSRCDMADRLAARRYSNNENSSNHTGSVHHPFGISAASSSSSMLLLEGASAASASATTTEGASAIASAYSDGSTSLLSSAISSSPHSKLLEVSSAVSSRGTSRKPSRVSDWLNTAGASKTPLEVATSRNKAAMVEADDGALSPILCLPSAHDEASLLSSTYASMNSSADADCAGSRHSAAPTSSIASSNRPDCVDSYAQTDEILAQQMKQRDGCLTFAPTLGCNENGLGLLEQLQSYHCLASSLCKMCDGCKRTLIESCARLQTIELAEVIVCSGPQAKKSESAVIAEDFHLKTSDNRLCDINPIFPGDFDTLTSKLNHAKSLPVESGPHAQRRMRSMRWLSSHQSRISGDDRRNKARQIGNDDLASETGEHNGNGSDKIDTNDEKAIDETFGNVFQVLLSSFEAAIDAIDEEADQTVARMRVARSHSNDNSCQQLGDEDLLKVADFIPTPTSIDENAAGVSLELLETHNSILTDIERLDGKFREIRDMRCSSPPSDALEQLLDEYTAQEQEEMGLSLSDTASRSFTWHQVLPDTSANDETLEEGEEQGGRKFAMDDFPAENKLPQAAGSRELRIQENEYAEIDSPKATSKSVTEYEKLYNESQRIYEIMLQNLNGNLSPASENNNSISKRMDDEVDDKSSSAASDWTRIEQLVSERIAKVKAEFYDEISSLQERLQSLQAMKCHQVSYDQAENDDFPCNSHKGVDSDRSAISPSTTITTTTTDTIDAAKQSDSLFRSSESSDKIDGKWHLNSTRTDSDLAFIASLQAEIDHLRTENFTFRKRLLDSTVNTIGKTLASVERNGYHTNLRYKEEFPHKSNYTYTSTHQEFLSGHTISLLNATDQH